MSGYEGTHQDWLEGQASDQLEREEYERSKFDDRSVAQGDGWEVVCSDGWVYVHDGGHVVAFPATVAVLVAHAILSEVEIAQRYPDYPGDDEPRLTGHPPNPETEDL